LQYDDIIIGSGLSALGVALGLGSQHRVLVLADTPGGTLLHYDQRRTVPCAFLGTGGLGNFWHGVIPLSRRWDFDGAMDVEFARLFRYFYPHAAIAESLRSPLLFVPWRAIRPQREFARLARTRADSLTLRPESADRFEIGDAGVRVHTRAAAVYRCRRLWIAAGTLHTPELLSRSGLLELAREQVSDHAFCYVGQIGTQTPPLIRRMGGGLLFPALYAAGAQALYTLRPARFGYRVLDTGIEQRAVFGLPTGSAARKIIRRLSPALLAEALYNRTGLFPRAAMYSVFAQTEVADAYNRRSGELPLEARMDRIMRATAQAREQLLMPGLHRSRRAELYIPGIHLHHSLELSLLAGHGINQPDSAVQIVDASVIESLGPDHPSFKLMLRAQLRAARAAA
jgi:hypothetical protein